MVVDPVEDGAPILQYGGYPPVRDVPDTLSSLFKNSRLKELQLGHGKLPDELFFGIAEGMPALTVLNLSSYLCIIVMQTTVFSHIFKHYPISGN